MTGERSALFFFGGAAGSPSTALVERAHSYRARSESTEGDLAAAPFSSCYRNADVEVVAIGGLGTDGWRTTLTDVPEEPFGLRGEATVVGSDGRLFSRTISFRLFSWNLLLG